MMRSSQLAQWRYNGSFLRTHSIWFKERRGISWLTERLLVCQEEFCSVKLHQWHSDTYCMWWRQKGSWLAWVTSFVCSAHLASSKDNFIIFAAIFARNLSGGTDCPICFTLITTRSCKVCENREEGSSNLDACHAHNRNPATQCIILFVMLFSACVVQICRIKKKWFGGLLVIVEPQPFSTGVICVRNRSRQSWMWSKEVDCFWLVTRLMTLLCRQKDIRARGCGRGASGQVSAKQLPHSPPT